MQRSPKSVIVDCFWRPHQTLLNAIRGWYSFRRTFASDSGRGGGSGRAYDGNTGGSGGSSTGSAPRASATSLVSGDPSTRYYTRGNVGALERRINREDNMWRDRGYVDTKWLNPRDPYAYRPNFRPTEPVSLRKQFMRSPDEISREVMSRDWERTVKNYRRSVMTNGRSGFTSTTSVSDTVSSKDGGPGIGAKASASVSASPRGIRDRPLKTWELSDHTLQYMQQRMSQQIKQEQDHQLTVWQQRQLMLQQEEKEQLENPQGLQWSRTSDPSHDQ
ncbi:uncharacterized protein [Drosophila bipectinata]|uniref:uncharacterized protein n=1 Tax=Drosophila bipectinata TaxID=42026 RepID=UPI001C894387|nr:uncharacterized protein LOC108121663 [Drosophila bipectinata]